MSSKRDIDLIVYGATGFTGKFVAKYLSKVVKEGRPLRWAIAGRSRPKLDDLIQELRADNLPEPQGVLIADAGNAASLTEMASKGRVVLNCTGPYRFLGEPVVVSCLEARTDYVDLCGEPEFMERIFHKYNKKAQELGVLIIHACAFDSVPADMGVIFTSQLFQSPGAVANIESFLTITAEAEGTHGHLTTYEAAVHGFGSADELARIRREIRKEYPIDDKKKIGPSLQSKTGPFYDARPQKYAFRFPGSDSSVVRSTQRQLILHGKDPASLPRYAAYFTVSSKLYAGLTAVAGGVFQSLAKYEWGRRLLLSAPSMFSLGAFSAEGPSAAEMAGTSFTMTFYASGYSGQGIDNEKLAVNLMDRFKGMAPDKFVTTRVGGPEPGYVATPIIFVELAQCLMEERSLLPVKGGGVFTPGAVFYQSTLIDRLKKAGIEFTVLEDSATPPERL